MSNSIRPDRRNFLIASAGMLCASAVPLARAQSYPNRPVKIIVAYAPGGANDMTARIYAEALSVRLQQSFVVENRPGASGISGTVQAAKAEPDGYTLMLGAGGVMTINPALHQNLSYEPLRDFAPIGLASRSPLVMVVPSSLPIKSVAELIAHARARPEGISFASPGAGTPLHLAGELFTRQAGIKALHVPYKGSAPGIADVIAGRVDLMCDALNSSLPFIRSGKLRALAVTTAQRSDQLPEVPTLQEAGLKDFDVSSWFGLFAPANTPREIVGLLAAELQKATAMPETRQKIANIGLETVSSTPEQLRAMIEREQLRWKEVVRQANIKP
ncbi:tripartite tricarboxylate transporter substrate binding protein [Ramlibacter sp. GTP1]|uniref:Tripartite tricarboxylate transporter substrate binding protein n=1 Tax=Ramlibacter albus TaxID=2079448 RepID=A0A923M4X8_9BURK|nr:tripartite tricarboxylate transporter substrate binding protein [Ramlibacter albus]